MKKPCHVRSREAEARERHLLTIIGSIDLLLIGIDTRSMPIPRWLAITYAISSRAYIQWDTCAASDCAAFSQFLSQRLRVFFRSNLICQQIFSPLIIHKTFTCTIIEQEQILQLRNFTIKKVEKKKYITKGQIRVKRSCKNFNLSFTNIRGFPCGIKISILDQGSSWTQ